MFNKDNARYMTAGINIELPLEIQALLWQLIDDVKGVTDLDYLQVFELSTVLASYGSMQKIVHRQVSQFIVSYMFVSDNPVNLKIFVIDDGPHSTMLLAQEY